MYLATELWPILANLALIFSTFSLFGILGCWVAYDMDRWPRRLSVPCALLALLWPVDAGDLAVTLFCVVVTVMLCVAGKRLQVRRRLSTESEVAIKLNFRMAHLLAFVFYSGVAIGAIQNLISRQFIQYPVETVPYYVLLGVLFGGTMAAGVAVARIESTRRRFLALLALSIVILVAMQFRQLSLAVGLVQDALWLTRTISIFPMLLLLGAYCASRTQLLLKHDDYQVFSRPVRIAGAALLIPAPLIALAALYDRPAPPRQSERNALQFEQLNKLVGAADRHPIELDPSNASIARETVTRHRKSLDAARALLQKPCRHTFRFRPGYWLDPYERGGLTHLSAILVSNAMTLRFEGKPDEAAIACLDVFRLAQSYRNGGRPMHVEFEVKIEQFAAAELIRLTPTIGASTARKIIEGLAQLERDRESLEILHARNSLWDEGWTTWQNRLYCRINRLSGFPHVLNHELDRNGLTLLRILQADLAVRIYQTKHHETPDCLDDLVPDITREILIDPHSCRPLRYRRLGEDWQVYSVGPDLLDDNGRGPALSFDRDNVEGDLTIDREQDYTVGYGGRVP